MERFTRDKLIHRNVTLYFHGETFGAIHKVEARAYHLQTGAYAQYANAVECFFVPRNARNPRGMVQTYKPSLLILDGWDHPDTLSMFEPERAGNTPGVTVRRSRFSAFAPEWRKIFDTMIALHISGENGVPGAKVIADYRGHNSHEVSAAPVAAAL